MNKKIKCFQVCNNTQVRQKKLSEAE